MANVSRTFVMAGLTTTGTTVPAAGIYMAQGNLYIPEVSTGDVADSQVVVTVNQNGSPVYVGNPSAKGFKAPINCQAGDSISITLSSSAAVDQLPNVIKCMVAIS